MFRGEDKRAEVRYDLLECAMLWRPSGVVPERAGPALITNASIGGVQIRTRQDFEASERLLLQLGSDNGPMFIPGKIRYVADIRAGGWQTFGFHFEPQTMRDREAVGKYVHALRERLCAAQ